MFGVWCQAPTLKRETIRKIASDLCNLNDSEIDDDALQMKRVKTHPIDIARITPVPPLPEPVGPQHAEEEEGNNPVQEK